jgi:endonuclease YncB( thermonuclease family)
MGSAVLKIAGLIVFALALPAQSETLKGKVSRVRDGDTIVVGQTPIRLSTLDCPEMDERGGLEAKLRMIELTRKRSVICDLEGRRSYDREVGDCALLDGTDLGEVMIAEGFCGRW